MERAIAGFRKQFSFSNLPVANWFPGHMAKGTRDIARRLQYCDCVIEVHDARIPFSGRNPNLNYMLRGRPKLLVLNKMDLADSAKSESVLKALQREGEREVLFTNLRKQHDSTIKELMTKLLNVVGWRRGQSSSVGAKQHISLSFSLLSSIYSPSCLSTIQETEDSIRLMVVGMPNVGKSSLINALRRNYMKHGKAAPVGKLPGVTRSVSTKVLVNNNPKMYLVDTPGVMIPNLNNAEVAIKLAVAGMLKDHFIGEPLIADYLLYLLNQQRHFEYVSYCRLENPSDDIEFVLTSLAKRIGALIKGGSFDLTRAAQHFLVKYREGHFGRMTLDNILVRNDHTCTSQQ